MLASPETPDSNARMGATAAVSVQIDLACIRRNLEDIRRQAGVAVLAVVKADAYGLGIDRVLPAIADGVEGFCIFNLAEARDARILERTGKSSLALGPTASENVDEYLAQGVRPAVWDAGRAAELRRADPVLCVDTGMQRFACPPEQIDDVLRGGNCKEAFTHATNPRQLENFLQLVRGRGLKIHAAGSSLLSLPEARLDAVRPGLALYRGAARVSTALVEARNTKGPAGYTGFAASRHGVILAGYSNGLRPGSCLVNGRRAKVVEVGMQSAFVNLCETDRTGDEVVLLGDSLTEMEVAAGWNTSPQEALFRLCSMGMRRYVA